jgi:hypothetical protein
MNDDTNLTRFPSEVTLYAAHVNTEANLNPHARSLAISFSLDLYEKSKEILSTVKATKKTKTIINNFNVTMHQEVRAAIDLALTALLHRDFHVDYKNTSREDYANQLATSAAIYAFGGSFYQNPATYWYMNELHKENKYFNVMHNFPSLGKRTAVFRWDSWRFWEALIFGCPPFQLNFEKYGFKLRENPKKWEHYIPLDLSAIKETVYELNERLREDPNYLAMLGERGREWAIEHYHPFKLAKLFLDEID